MMRFILIAACLLPLFAGMAQAQNTPLIFRREAMTIVPKAPPPIVLTEDSVAAPAPKKDDKKEENAEAEATPSAPEPLVFNVEVRGERAMRLEGITSLARLDDTSGVMIMFGAPIDLPQMRLNIYTPIDALMVDEEGTIFQIMPELVLGQMAEDIPNRKPVLAFLYLKAGVCAEKGIVPGSRIEHPFFMPKPTVLE